MNVTKQSKRKSHVDGHCAVIFDTSLLLGLRQRTPTRTSLLAREAWLTGTPPCMSD